MQSDRRTMRETGGTAGNSVSSHLEDRRNSSFLFARKQGGLCLLAAGREGELASPLYRETGEPCFSESFPPEDGTRFAFPLFLYAQPIFLKNGKGGTLGGSWCVGVAGIEPFHILNAFWPKLTSIYSRFSAKISA
jgi:hypothetical protein